MTIEVHKNGEELVAVRPDPFVWVDPFAEAEEWAVMWGKAATGWAEGMAKLQAEHADERIATEDDAAALRGEHEQFRARVKGIAKAALDLRDLPDAPEMLVRDLLRHLIESASDAEPDEEDLAAEEHYSRPDGADG